MLLLAAACGGGSETADEPEATAVEAVATEAPPTEVPPTEVPPTEVPPTEVPATPTPEPEPTATTEPTPTPEPEPTEAPTEAPLEAEEPTAEPDGEAVVEGEGEGETAAGAGGVDGAAIFSANCARCHGPGGNGSNQGPPLTGIGQFFAADASPLVEFVTNGQGFMPEFGSKLTAEEIEAVVAYVVETFQ